MTNNNAQSGSTMITALAFALIAGLGAAMFTMYYRNEVKVESIALRHENYTDMVTYLSNRADCTKTFGPMPPVSSTPNTTPPSVCNTTNGAITLKDADGNTFIAGSGTSVANYEVKIVCSTAPGQQTGKKIDVFIKYPGGESKKISSDYGQSDLCSAWF